MLTRPLVVDLCCKAGGAAMGYRRAGFDVVGIDRDPQPRYPGRFIQADIRDLTVADLRALGPIAAAHGSPPCGRFTSGAGQNRTRDRHPNLIPTVRALFQGLGVPWVIENVPGARPHLHHPILLCGQTFGLGVYRHRLFEVPWWTRLLHPHTRHRGRIGDGVHVTVAGSTGGASRRDGIRFGDKAAWSKAMGIDWMTADELRDAIPPAYTEYIGRALLAHLDQAAQDRWDTDWDRLCEHAAGEG